MKFIRYIFKIGPKKGERVLKIVSLFNKYDQVLIVLFKVRCELIVFWQIISLFVLKGVDKFLVHVDIVG